MNEVVVIYAVILKFVLTFCVGFEKNKIVGHAKEGRNKTSCCGERCPSRKRCQQLVLSPCVQSEPKERPPAPRKVNGEVRPDASAPPAVAPAAKTRPPRQEEALVNGAK